MTAPLLRGVAGAAPRCPLPQGTVFPQALGATKAGGNPTEVRARSLAGLFGGPRRNFAPLAVLLGVCGGEFISTASIIFPHLAINQGERLRATARSVFAGLEVITFH